MGMIMINEVEHKLNAELMDRIRRIKHIALDMDGTIYLGNELFSFTKKFLKDVEDQHKKYYFFTNNSSKDQQTYIDKLEKMEIEIKPEQMMISNHVAIKYLKENYEGKRLYIVGTPLLKHEFETAGFVLTEEDPDIVVLGFDTTLTYEKLSKACHYIRNGCTYFGINPDWNCPMEGGTFIPDCGSMAKLIEASTGRFPEFFGKPSKHTLDYIIQETGYEPDEIAIVGDRLYTDIAVADQSDVMSILVLSGESTREDVKTSDVKPNVILEDLSEITKML